jgi:flagellar secretion chaperone FliS
MKNPYLNYKNTMVGTASKEKLLLMLYEGAIKFCKLAKKHMQDKNTADKGLMIGRTMDIVFELRNTLDFKVGGDVAIQLEKLYNFMIDELTSANINNDSKNLDNVLSVLETLYSGWQEAVKQYQKEKGPESPLKEKEGE